MDYVKVKEAAHGQHFAQARNSLFSQYQRVRIFGLRWHVVGDVGVTGYVVSSDTLSDP